MVCHAARAIAVCGLVTRAAAPALLHDRAGLKGALCVPWAQVGLRGRGEERGGVCVQRALPVSSMPCLSSPGLRVCCMLCCMQAQQGCDCV